MVGLRPEGRPRPWVARVGRPWRRSPELAAPLIRRLDCMSDATYSWGMSDTDKPLVWLHGDIKTPPLARDARLEAGYLLRMLQQGRRLGMPQSRPMPSIGRNVHELRVRDADSTWRIVYRLDHDAIVIADVFAKKTQATPAVVIRNCQRRLAAYDAIE